LTGWLEKKSAGFLSRWERSFFVISGHHLNQYPDKETAEKNDCDPLVSWNINDVTDMKLKGVELELIIKGETVAVKTDSKEAMGKWENAIRAICEKNGAAVILNDPKSNLLEWAMKTSSRNKHKQQWAQLNLRSADGRELELRWPVTDDGGNPDEMESWKTEFDKFNFGDYIQNMTPLTSKDKLNFSGFLELQQKNLEWKGNSAHITSQVSS
jgi:hypothetical protein